jgi:hypothetical protein
VNVYDKDGNVVAWLDDEDVVRPEEDDSGYDVNDPKHPEWHSTHADLWDLREGK